MPEVNFYLKKAEGVPPRSLVYLQMRYNGQKLVYSMKFNVAKSNWDAKKQSVKSRSQTTADGSTNVNDLLKNIKEICLKTYHHEFANGIPSKESLKKALNDYMYQNVATKNKKTIWDLIDRFISGEIKDPLTKARKTAGTLKHYKTVKNHLTEFEKEKKYKVSFDSINHEFLDKYTDYLHSKLSQNTIHKNIQIIKVFLGRAVQEKLTSNTIFKERGFSVPTTEVEDIALSREEIEKLFRFDLSEKKTLEQVRDLFIFGCSVGLRISDFSNIHPSNIVTINGRKHIRMITQKTKTVVEIPCNGDVLEIFKKYESNPNSLPPTITDQKFNQYIKKAAERAGLTEKGRLVKNPERRLCEIISSKTARKSLCTNLYLEGVPISIIMKISGHKTETSFMKYIRISRKQASDTFTEHEEKRLTKSKLKAV
jgi:integrase